MNSCGIIMTSDAEAESDPAGSNTVLSLSALQKYDSIPFIVCIVTPAKII